MNKLTEEDIQNWKTSSLEECIFTWTPETNNLIIQGLELEEVEQLKKEILQNQKIVQEIQKAKQDMVKIISNKYDSTYVDVVVADCVLKILNNITDDEK